MRSRFWSCGYVSSGACALNASLAVADPPFNPLHEAGPPGPPERSGLRSSNRLTSATSGAQPGRTQEKELPPRTGEALLHLYFHPIRDGGWGGERLRPAERCETQ